MLHHGLIPRSLHYREPSPHIAFGQLGIAVAEREAPWPRADHPARAGVSAFGFGGSNAHVILEQAPAPAREPARGPAPAVGDFLISAADPVRLREQAGVLAAWVDATSPPLDAG